jgi:hypothetical protein
MKSDLFFLRMDMAEKVMTRRLVSVERKATCGPDSESNYSLISSVNAMIGSIYGIIIPEPAVKE